MQIQSVEDYAVVGNPVSHSLSPRIHQQFARQTSQSIHYKAVELPVEHFAAAMLELRDHGLRGSNVTVPFKQDAWHLCDERSSDAELAGAVNTLSFHDDGSIHGDNTDGIGLCRDLMANLTIRLENTQLLILGAGGAVRGVLQPLLLHNPACITIANRTVSKAFELADHFQHLGNLQACSFDATANQHYDLIINATAAGLSNELPALPDELVNDSVCCYDMMYNITQDTAFVAWSRAQGAAAAHDGLGMLVEQAAESFHIWRGITPLTEPVIHSLRQSA